MYFRLNSDVYLLGEKNPTIYNSKENSWYALQQHTKEIIEMLERNICIEKVESNLGSIKELLNYLVDSNLGNYYDKKTHIEKYLPNNPLTKRILRGTYKRVFVQLTNECDVDCNFCSSKESYFWQGCMSCSLKKKNSENMLPIFKLIDLLEKLGMEELIIRGGNPLLNREDLYKVLCWIEKRTERITIILPGTKWTEEDLYYFNRIRNRIRIIIVMVGIDKEAYEARGISEKVFNAQSELIKKLKELGISYSIAINYDQDTKEIPDQLLKQVVPKYGKAPILCEKVAINQSFAIEKSQFYNRISYTANKSDFYSRGIFNKCLYGTISIDIEGNVAPCPMINYDVVGKIGKDNLIEIKSNHLNQWWGMTRTTDKICSECGLKYLCISCSAIEQNPLVKTRICKSLILDNNIIGIHKL